MGLGIGLLLGHEGVEEDAQGPDVHGGVRWLEVQLLKRDIES
jgi:hypothetical protein